MRTLALLLTVLGAASAWNCAGGSLLHAAQEGTVNPRAEAMTAFQARAEAYMKLHERVADGLPPLEETEDAVKITAREKALGAAIRKARAGAREGDIFGEGVRPLFEKILREDWDERSRRSKYAIEAQVPDRPGVRVNEVYPELRELATVPPVLLQRLPRLPDGLEYRLFGRHLILRDTTANLVVDVLRDVLPGKET